MISLLNGLPVSVFILATQEEYYATHQCFLTSRSLFLLVWNIEDGEAGLQALRPWLENIEVGNSKHHIESLIYTFDCGILRADNTRLGLKLNGE